MPQATPKATDILVISAHPQMELSRVNRTLMRAAAEVLRVQVRDLYALYPDPSNRPGWSSGSTPSTGTTCIRRAVGQETRPRLHHRLPGCGHRHRALGPAAGD